MTPQQQLTFLHKAHKGLSERLDKYQTSKDATIEQIKATESDLACVNDLIKDLKYIINLGGLEALVQAAKSAKTEQTLFS
jgi:hypothetical protein